MTKKTTNQERGRYSRNKGKVFEQALVRLFKEHGFLAKREWEYDEGKTYDVTVKVDNQTSFRIQAKCMANQPNISKIMSEMEVDEINDIPMVVFKVSRKGVYAAFKIDDAMLLMNAFGIRK